MLEKSSLFELRVMLEVEMGDVRYLIELRVVRSLLEGFGGIRLS